MKCCCGHDEAMHLGGADLSESELYELRAQKPDGDGGMCRAHVPYFKHGRSTGGRCDCFNFCDCHELVAEIQLELAADSGEVAL